MPLRALMRFLLNNEQLIQRLSESYPVKRAAQLAVSMMYRSKFIMGKQSEKLTNSPNRFKSFIDNVREECKKLNNEYNKKPK